MDRYMSYEPSVEQYDVIAGYLRETLGETYEEEEKKEMNGITPTGYCLNKFKLKTDPDIEIQLVRESRLKGYPFLVFIKAAILSFISLVMNFSINFVSSTFKDKKINFISDIENYTAN